MNELEKIRTKTKDDLDNTITVNMVLTDGGVWPAITSRTIKMPYFMAGHTSKGMPVTQRLFTYSEAGNE